MSKPTCKPSPNLTAQAVQCIKKPSVTNCVVKPVVKTVLDPCMQNHITYNGAQDPYLKNMPKHDVGEAV